jgi:hypothetical protein
MAKEQVSWIAKDKTVWKTEAEAEERDRIIEAKEKETSRLAIIRKHLPYVLEEVLSRSGEYAKDSVWAVVAYNEDDVALLKKNGIYLGSDYELGKVYIYHDIDYINTRGDFCKIVDNEEKVRLEIDSYEAEAKRLASKAREDFNKLLVRSSLESE